MLDRESLRDRATLQAATDEYGTRSAVARAYGIPEPTLQHWYAYQQEGRVWDGARWVLPRAAVEDDDSAAIRREWLDYLKARPSLPEGRPPRESKSGKRYAVEVVGCDLHAPLHHEAAFELFLTCLSLLEPDGVTLNGDTLDMAQVSRFAKRPTAHGRLIDDIEWAREYILGRINAAAPEALKTYNLGNHEGQRWERYLLDRCPEISDFPGLQIDVLLGLAEMGWRFEPDGYELISDVFVVDHGDRHTSSLGGGSAMSARKESIDVGLSGCSGHTHHGGKFWRLDNSGYRVWAEGFCLCDQYKMREAHVTAHKRGHKIEDWHIGFLLVYHEVGGEAFHIVDVPIMESRRQGKTFCILNGEEVSV